MSHLAFRLTPHGHLVLEQADDAPGLDPTSAARLAGAFARGTGPGLLQLGAGEVGQALPPALAWWRGFAARYVTALCLHAPDTDADAPSRAALPAVAVPDAAELAALSLTAPMWLTADAAARLPAPAWPAHSLTWRLPSPSLRSLLQQMGEDAMDAILAMDGTILPPGIAARLVENGNGLRMHVLEAGFEAPGRPCLLLLHGFPELAYSWRKVMPALAQAGYHVVAPDQRGYGRTTGWNPEYDGDLGSFRMLNLVRDVLGLLDAIGHARVAAVVGHDFGAAVAAWCALLRPDIFPAVALMSAPFAGPPGLHRTPQPDIHAALAALPRPRKHYQWHYSTRDADSDMRHAAQGLHGFLRGYYHHKSADWPGNRPFPLAGWTAEELAKLPTYYIMDLDADMATTVAAEMPDATQVAACRWLPDTELAVYAAEYARTGFQGGLQWYRCRTSGRFDAELEVFAGRSIDVPSCFISGVADWGIHQAPGALERMQSTACTRMAPVALLQGAGHWVQQEQPDEVVRCLLGFLGRPVSL